MPSGASDTAVKEGQPQSKGPAPRVPAGLRIWGMALRTAFIITLLLIVLRVAMPQSETVWTAYDTPNDLVRLVLGVGVGIWLVFQLFGGPKRAAGFRTWLYLGIVAEPFALICLLYVWWARL